MLKNSSNSPVADVADWHERNPNYTRWYWHYDEARGDNPAFHLHLRIVVRGALTGLDTNISGGHDTCYQIREDTKAIDTVGCPLSANN